MGERTKRAALYLRVSTGEQDTDSQRHALEEVCRQRGWEIAQTYEDAGISGGKGRDQRPGLDAMLKEAARARFDVLLAWSVDRLGRSLPDLIGTLHELRDAHVDLFLHRQAVDTSTPAGRALFGMLGVFAEFERAMIQERIRAGIANAKAKGVTRSGKPFGRPKIGTKAEAVIRARLASGAGIIKVARELKLGVGTVQRVAREVERPLFLPLARRWFEEFRGGTKTEEWRRYGRQWTERTCWLGRPVELALGYSRKNILTGTVVSFETRQAEGDLATLYGLGTKCAVIGIRIDGRPIDRNVRGDEWSDQADRH